MPTGTRTAGSELRGRVVVREEFSASIELDRDSSIDDAAGVVRNVKVNSNKSRNRRRYRDEVLEPATPLYEGVKVFRNHWDPGIADGRPRQVEAFMGRLKNVRFHPGGHRADLHVAPSRRTWLADVKADPAAFGLSHNAVVEVVELEEDGWEGWEDVVRIVEVLSVDVVTDPATTRGMFESKEQEGEDVSTEAAKADGREKVVALLEAREKELREQLDGTRKERDEIKAKVSALETAIEGLKKENGELRVKVEAAERAERAAKIEAAIASSGLAEDVRKSLQEAVKDLPADAAVRVVETTKKAVGTAPASSSAAGKPRSEARQSPSAGSREKEPSDEEALAAFGG